VRAAVLAMELNTQTPLLDWNSGGSDGRASGVPG
jgi:hypothetical protein